MYMYVYSVVEFATLGDMKNAITKMNNTDLNGKKIRLTEDRGRRGGRHRYCIIVLLN